MVFKGRHAETYIITFFSLMCALRKRVCEDQS